MYEYGISVNGRVFINVTEDRAQTALEATREVCHDPDVVELVRRTVGEWETVK